MSQDEDLVERAMRSGRQSKAYRPPLEETDLAVRQLISVNDRLGRVVTWLSILAQSPKPERLPPPATPETARERVEARLEREMRQSLADEVKAAQERYIAIYGGG